MDNEKRTQEGGMMRARELAAEINRAFGEPFLPKGFVRAKVMPGKPPWLNIKIGDRDVDFEIKGSTIVKFSGSGTNVGEGREWAIREIGKVVSRPRHCSIMG